MNTVTSRPHDRARQTRLAWRNLADTPVRTIVSLGGIGFAILLIFMQLGFLGSVGDTATVVYDRMRCDVLVRSPDYINVYDPASVPEELTQWLAGVRQVRRIIPLDMGVTQWQNPSDHSFRAIGLMGIDLDQPAFDLPELSPTIRAKLRPRGSVLVDDASGSDFGPRRGDRFSKADIGVTTDVAGSEATIQGTFRMGTGLAANGAILSSRETFGQLAPGGHEDRVSLILVQLVDPEQLDLGLRAVQRRVQSLGGPAAHCETITLAQAKSSEKWMWYTQTPIGMIFGMGVALAVIVGGVISYMVLAADVAAHLSEYATLKAMGYSNRFLIKTLLTQSSLLAAFAFLPALGVSLILYHITSIASGISIDMTWLRIGLVFALSLVMCNAAGAMALRKLIKAEPANLF